METDSLPIIVTWQVFKDDLLQLGTFFASLVRAQVPPLALVEVPAIEEQCCDSLKSRVS